MAHDLFFRPKSRSSRSSSRSNPIQESEMISDSECREQFPCRGVQGSCEELVECERRNRDNLNRLYIKCLKKYENHKKSKRDTCNSIKHKLEKSDRRIEEQKNKEWRLVKSAAAFVIRQIGVFNNSFLIRLSDDLTTIENIKIVKQFLYKYTDDEYDSFNEEKQKHILFLLMVYDLQLRADDATIHKVIDLFHEAMSRYDVIRSRGRTKSKSKSKSKGGFKKQNKTTKHK